MKDIADLEFIWLGGWVGGWVVAVVSPLPPHPKLEALQYVLYVKITALVRDDSDTQKSVW